MKIEEYGINVSITFHDIRKQGYEVPVDFQIMLKSFGEKISLLPLVRGEFKFFRNDHFSISSTIGFKSGVFMATQPKLSYVKWDATRRQPQFKYTATGFAPVYGAIPLLNKSEYTRFLRALEEFVMEASAQG